MSKRKEPEADEWKDLSQKWTGKGPDPRIQPASFSVISYDTLFDPTDPFSEGTDGKGYWQKAFKTFEAARKAYEKRIRRAETKQCDIQMHMRLCGYYQYFQEVYRPSFSETYIYLVRWRQDGAFLESYHINESRFGERNTKQRADELQRPNQPGLLSYWEKKHEEEKAKKE